MNAGMRKHEPDAVSLVFGGLYFAVVAWWLIARIVDVDLPNLAWVAGAALIAVGVLGLWTTLGPNTRQGS
jgi:hypothetical protein